MWKRDEFSSTLKTLHRNFKNNLFQNLFQFFKFIKLKAKRENKESFIVSLMVVWIRWKKKNCDNNLLAVICRFCCRIKLFHSIWKMLQKNYKTCHIKKCEFEELKDRRDELLGGCKDFEIWGINFSSFVLNYFKKIENFFKLLKNALLALQPRPKNSSPRD